MVVWEMSLKQMFKYMITRTKGFVRFAIQMEQIIGF